MNQLKTRKVIATTHKKTLELAERRNHWKRPKNHKIRARNKKNKLSKRKTLRQMSLADLELEKGSRERLCWRSTAKTKGAKVRKEPELKLKRQSNLENEGEANGIEQTTMNSSFFGGRI